MYCRKCGQQLRKDAMFCHNCGNQVINEENSTSHLSTPDNSIFENKNFIKNSFVKFCVYILFFLVIGSILMSLQQRNVIAYMQNSSGLIYDIGSCFGAATIQIILLLPFLYGLKMCGFTKSTYKAETFLILLFLFMFGILWHITKQLYTSVLPPITLFFLIIGVFMLIFAFLKK